MTCQLLPKVYIKVSAVFGSDGTVLPTAITWENGNQYQIDEVLGIRQAVSMRSGGTGDKYKIKVQCKERYLFFERPQESAESIGKWFVAGR